MLLHRLSESGRRCRAGAEAQAKARGHRLVLSDHLLVGVLTEQGRAARLLAAQEVDATDVGAALGPILRPATTSNHLQLLPSEDEVTVEKRALALADAREHVMVRDTHLVLAMLSEPSSAGYRLLARCGANPATIAVEFERELETVHPDEQALETLAWPEPLPAPQVRTLVTQTRASNTALRDLRDRGGELPEGERVALERIRDSTGAAPIQLELHHRWLAFNLAKACAAEGHQLSYAFFIANQALWGICFDPPPQGPFTEHARMRITQALNSRLGCTHERGEG